MTDKEFIDIDEVPENETPMNSKKDNEIVEDVIRLAEKNNDLWRLEQGNLLSIYGLKIAEITREQGRQSAFEEVLKEMKILAKQNTMCICDWEDLETWLEKQKGI